MSSRVCSKESKGEGSPGEVALGLGKDGTRSTADCGSRRRLPSFPVTFAGTSARLGRRELTAPGYKGLQKGAHQQRRRQVLVPASTSIRNGDERTVFRLLRSNQSSSGPCCKPSRIGRANTRAARQHVAPTPPSSLLLLPILLLRRLAPDVRILRHEHIDSLTDERREARNLILRNLLKAVRDDSSDLRRPSAKRSRGGGGEGTFGGSPLCSSFSPLPHENLFPDSISQTSDPVIPTYLPCHRASARSPIHAKQSSPSQVRTQRPWPRRRKTS